MRNRIRKGVEAGEVFTPLIHLCDHILSQIRGFFDVLG